MMTEHRRFTWLLALILMFPGLALAARVGRLVGKVVDPDGSPIPGVTVTASSPDVPDFGGVMVTDEKGVFKVDLERVNVVYHYRFEKPGYVTTRAEQEWSYIGTKRHEFTMARAEAPPPDAPPPPSASTPAVQAFNEGFAAYEAGDSTAARAKLEEATQHDPGLRLAWELLSQIHLAAERYPEAAEAAEKAIGLGSRDAAVLRARWEAYRSLGDEAKTAEARADLEQLDRLTEEAKRIYNEGVGLLKADNAEEAFARFQEALDVDPNLQVARLGLATVGLEIGRYEEAAAAAETILTSDPGNEQALRLRYNAALELKDEERVAAALVGLAKVEPELARDTLFQLATMAFDADDTTRAKARLARVLELDPDHPRSHYLMGLILVREGAGAEARTQLERFLELAPDDPDAQTAQGLIDYLKES